MAQRVESFKVSVPAGRRLTNPKVYDLSFLPGIVRELELVIPNGHAGLTGIRITAAHTPLIPVTVGQWISSNDEIIRWPLENYIESGNWGALAYNEDLYPHSFYVRFLVDPPRSAATAARPPGFAPTAPLSSAEIEAGEGGLAVGAGGEGTSSGGEPEALPPPVEAPPGAGGEEPEAEPPEAEPPEQPGEEPEAPAPPPAGPEAPEAPPAEAEPPEAEPAAPAAEGEGAQGAGAKPGHVATPTVPTGLTNAQQIAFYHKESARLERLSDGLRRQIKAHPRSPAVPAWRIVLSDYAAAIAHMRELIAKLHRLPPKAPAKQKVVRPPSRGRGRPAPGPGATQRPARAERPKPAPAPKPRPAPHQQPPHEKHRKGR